MLWGLHKQELTCSCNRSILGQLKLFRNRVQPAFGTLTAVVAEEEENVDNHGWLFYPSVKNTISIHIALVASHVAEREPMGKEVHSSSKER